MLPNIQQWNPGPPPPGRLRRRRRPRQHIWLRLGLLLVAVFLVLQIGLSPWVLHIGGKFTPTMSWSGYGSVQASNGGKYELYTQFKAGMLQATVDGRGMRCDKFSGCDNVLGTAKLCAANGTTSTFSLTGQVHAWLATEGSTTSLAITGGAPKPLPDGWLVALRGTWHGSALTVSSPDNSFTEVFTPRGAIRTTTSTADAGTATVTLRPGSQDGFSQACRALAS